MELNRILLLGGVFTLVLSSIGGPIATAAGEDALISGSVSTQIGPILSESTPNDQSMLAFGKRRGCINEQVTVVLSATEQVSDIACVTHGENLRYTVFRNTTPVISTGSDEKMYKINVTEMSELIPGTNTLVFIYGVGTSWALNISKDLSAHITKNFTNGFTTYSFEDSSMLKAGLSLNPQVAAKIFTYGFSQNGRFLVWLGEDYQPTQYKIIDLQTNNIKAFDFDPYGQNVPNQDMTVSDDGKLVAWVSQRTLKVWKNENCGYDIPMSSSFFDPQYRCSMRQYDLSTMLNTSPLASSFGLNFNSNPVTLSLLHAFNDGIRPVSFTASSDSATNHKLDYLALGDSYSSGEGDIGKFADGSSFYIPGTEDSKGCHVSIRSYPFLLAQRNNLEENRMQSIACSGARVSRDYYGAGDTYYGQGNKFKNKTETELATLRDNAARDFTPGVLKQIEFVKNNKPKIVTLTGGGNDVGIVDVLKSCMFAYGIGERAKTCDEAVVGTKKRSVLGDSIRSQFVSTVELIDAIKQASNSTTIYVVGYPSFITDGAAACVNSGTLNNSERSTINTSLNYLNDILEAAAKEAGAKYVDTTDSLAGGRICEGSKYVTGVVNVLTSASQLSNMFHPNSDGHIKLANTISSNGFSVSAEDNPSPVSTPAPVKPSIFGSSTYVPTTQEKLLTSDAVVEVGSALGFTTPLNSLLTAGDKVSFTLYSNPTNLGTFTVSSSGTAGSTVRLPRSIDPGMHMLLAEVVSKGITIQRFYEYIEIVSNNPTDRDADGIKDSKDPCMFIGSWYDEGSTQNICKPVDNSQSGHGNNNGHSGGQPKPTSPAFDYWKYWKSKHLHHVFGVMICFGILTLRFR